MRASFSHFSHVPFVAIAPFIEDEIVRTYFAYPGVFFAGLSAIFSFIGSFYFYARVGLRATGLIRKKSLMIAFGLILIYFGFIGGSTMNTEMGYGAGLVGPATMILGAVMVIRGHEIKV